MHFLMPSEHSQHVLQARIGRTVASYDQVARWGVLAHQAMAAGQTAGRLWDDGGGACISRTGITIALSSAFFLAIRAGADFNKNLSLDMFAPETIITLKTIQNTVKAIEGGDFKPIVPFRNGVAYEALGAAMAYGGLFSHSLQ